MKKIKIMLTAIAVLSVVGGALAFKATRLSMRKICSGLGPFECDRITWNSTTTIIGDGQSFYYTQVPDIWTNCYEVTICPTQTYLTAE